MRSSCHEQLVAALAVAPAVAVVNKLERVVAPRESGARKVANRAIALKVRAARSKEVPVGRVVS